MQDKDHEQELKDENAWLENFTFQTQQWMTAACGDAHLLPFWDQTNEISEHADAIRNFHTVVCDDFQRGFCAKHGAKGKASQCVRVHFESQRRRCPIDPITGHLTYWETPCSSWSSDASYCCSAGDACPFAHGREEVSYHPSKYKTRPCNGHDCRGEGACCFAHSEQELRHWAPASYSYASIRSSANQIAEGGEVGSRHQSTAVSQSLPQKHRFCSSYPNVSQCRRGAACAFAHARDEVLTPLLSLAEEEQEESALTEDFFTRKFKTMWCPIGAQHDWQTCVYAHTYQDARRQPSIGYGPQPCPYWSKKDTHAYYSQRCPIGLRCPYAHGAKEQLYHPKYFRTVICRDMQMKGCPRQSLCAFYHRRGERRKTSTDGTNYNIPLSGEAIDKEWAAHFLAPPIFQDGTEGDEATDIYGGGMLFPGNGFWAKATEHTAESPRTHSTVGESDGADYLGISHMALSEKASLLKAAETDPLAAAVLGAWFADGCNESVDSALWAGTFNNLYGNQFYTSQLEGFTCKDG
jgi:L,D-peptidoglycan transpeptidase YkuD (ErfK/YbiS/YcfS/YnhG family)